VDEMMFAYGAIEWIASASSRSSPVLHSIWQAKDGLVGAGRAISVRFAGGRPIAVS
jgi:hypothetical protein